MRFPVLHFTRGFLVAAVVGLHSTVAQADPISLSSTWQANDYNQPASAGAHVTLTGESSTGYTYSGTGTAGLPGTTVPDSRRRPKIYQDFAAFNAGGLGSTLSMTYDILWGGTTTPLPNSSQNWRFGFVGSAANGGKGVTLGANFDIGDLAGTTAYEFFTDTSVTSGLGTPASGTMDSAFTDTLNDPNDDIARFAQSNADPFADNVAFNDLTDTHRVTLTLTRILNGYDLSFAWQNLVSTNTIFHSTTITTSDPDPSVALAAGVTSWDRLGFFINADSLGSPAKPWNYTLSNVGVDAVAVPEPSSIGLVLLSIAAVAGAARRRRR
jgi:hypothetical protein